jgi:hypothetical protein
LNQFHEIRFTFWRLKKHPEKFHKIYITNSSKFYVFSECLNIDFKKPQNFYFTMNIKSLASILLATVASIGIAVPAFAAPAVLVGKETGSRVNVRAYPSTRADSPHYGLVGDRVEVLKQTEGQDGYTWYYVEFSSGARGWIRADFIRFIAD